MHKLKWHVNGNFIGVKSKSKNFFGTQCKNISDMTCEGMEPQQKLPFLFQHMAYLHKEWRLVSLQKRRDWPMDDELLIITYKTREDYGNKGNQRTISWSNPSPSPIDNPFRF
jgi:hypothetical protein